jgi:DNA-binding IclR family transcriptional regulator
MVPWCRETEIHDRRTGVGRSTSHVPATIRVVEQAFAVPVRDDTEHAAAALAVFGFVRRPHSRFGDARRGEPIALVTDAARRRSARLGYPPPPGGSPGAAWQPAGLHPATS